MHTERGALPKPARRDDVPMSGAVYSIATYGKVRIRPLNLFP